MHNAARYVLGGFAGAAIVSGVGISVAMANDSENTGQIEVTHSANFTDENLDGFIARLAANLGVSVEELRAAIEQTLSQEVGIAADEGELPQEIADALQNEIENDLFDGEIDIDGILESLGGMPEIRVDTGCIVAFQPSVGYDIQLRRQNQIRPVRWRRVVLCHAERTRTCLAAIPSTQPAGEPDHRRRARADAGRPGGRLDPWRVGESPRRR